MSRIFIVIFLLVAVDGVCQQTLDIHPVSRFFKLYPQEQAFLITDNSTYIHGESIWYKVYLWNADDEQVSEDVRVLLRDASGRIIEEQRVVMSGGECQGDFQIAETQKAGIYRIDVVTDWSMNFQNFPIATRLIRLAGKSESEKSDSNTMTIVAEGGGLVAGKENRIGFFTGGFQLENFTMEVTGPAGATLLQKSMHGVYAVEKIAVDQPGVYTATLCAEDGRCVTEKILTDDQTLRIVSQTNDRIRIHTAGSEEHSIVVCSTNAVVDHIKLQHGGEFEFIVQQYPSGLYYFLLVDERENTIKSSLAVYKRPSTPPFQIAIAGNESQNTFVSKNFMISTDNRFPVHTIIAANDARSGHFMLSDLSNSQIDELLVFERFPLHTVLSDFLKKKKFDIKRKLPQELSIQARTKPLDVILSEVHVKPRTDSVAHWKSLINRVKTDYQPARPLRYAIPVADDSYLMADYNSIKTATEFLDQAMPRLKKVNATSTSPYRFFYTNLRDQKLLYEESPRLIVNGVRVPSFRALEAFDIAQIKRIQALYNSRTLLETNLQKILPGGGIFVEVEEVGKPLLPLKGLQRFSGQYAWPHLYEPFTESPSTDQHRLPALNAIYHWTNYGLSPKNKRMFTVHLPIVQLQKTALATFSLESVRHGSYFKMPLDGKF